MGWRVGAVLSTCIVLATPQSAAAFSPVPPDAVMGDGLKLYTPDPDQPDTIAEVCADGETLFGVDVSHWQGSIDWASVADDGVSFAIVRCSDGLGTIDDYFDENIEGSRGAGLPTGVYQFFRPGQDVIAQADLMISMINEHGGLLPGDLPPVIDVEDNGGLSPSEVSVAVGDWINRIESELGVTPLIYSGKYFWQDNVQSSTYSEYPLWAAHYTSGCPNIADQWSDWVIHQYSDAGSVAGISGGVDSNDFNGGLTELLALTVAGGGECGDGTCDPGENETSCPEDCPPCALIGPEGAVLDELGECFFAGGDPGFWREEASGWEEHHLWTVATAASSPANYGLWNLFFEEAGSYELDVYIELGAAGSEQSPYQIRHDGLDSLHSVNQSSIDGWTSLGEFNFAAGGSQSVRLDDNTGEDWEFDRALVFDAIRLTPMGGAGEESGGESESGDDDDATDGLGQEEVGTADDDGFATESSADESCGDCDASGCICAVGRSPGGHLAWLAFFVWGAVRRRRRADSCRVRR